jgi:hypothetical protein
VLGQNILAGYPWFFSLAGAECPRLLILESYNLPADALIWLNTGLNLFDSYHPGNANTYHKIILQEVPNLVVPPNSYRP